MFSPDGRTLAVVNGIGSDTSDVLLCDVPTRKVVARIRNAKVRVFLGKGDRIVVVCQSRPTEGDWRAKIYSVPGAKLLTICPPDFFPKRGDKNGQMLIGLKEDWNNREDFFHGDFFRWDLRSKAAPKRWYSFPVLPKAEEHSRYWLSADNSTLVDLTGTATTSEYLGQTLYFRNVSTGKIRLRIRKGTSSELQYFSINAQGLFAYLDSNSLDSGRVKIWNCKTGRLRSSFPIKLALYTRESALSPDGTLLAFSGPGGAGIRLWNTSSGKLVRTLKHDKFGSGGMAFSPDGRTLASSDGICPGTVKLWRIK